MLIVTDEPKRQKKLIRRPRTKAGALRSYRDAAITPLNMTAEQLQAAICPKCGRLTRHYCTKNFEIGQRIQFRKCDTCGETVKVPIGQ